ncbi:gliding motility-associated C-terminal domain-containing protein [Flavobacterium sp. NKUCC04_CG]|uniref:gliding motility-associated C-terminal domain-containing protein n=1 Tax=Flavobacterium sp. NKUCC04_CG TaxID=2842121 RepID=UPI001C5B9973|nr:gliding motility-associated C-terminal domain-containing protein [Flavobacterium sp. NKUCC04_CG]MBW3520371.1 gliding motility-associated C-terminal domain-containing protein [Flavobacterium sp. NKUCC04_CG]
MKYKIYTVCLIAGISVHAQEVGMMVNVGDVYISPQTELSIIQGFDNTATGILYNDGDLFLQDYLKNNGLFTFNQANKTGYTIFEGTGNGKQLISGDKPIAFMDVLFNKTTANTGFDLKNDISIAGTANFTKGIVEVDSLDGAMVFEINATAINVSNNSHVNGEVEKRGNKDFVYPIGDGTNYRRAEIGAPKAVADLYSSRYYNQNTFLRHPAASKAGVILDIDDSEYWTMKQLNTKNDIILTLSWDEKTTPSHLLKSPEKNLHIVRWDNEKKLWVDEGGIVDLNTKTVRTATFVDGYGVFTLATVKQEYLLDGDLVIYNAVSTNGDGINDYFLIDKIQKYPNNTVQIFNRWGVKVFETAAYDTTGNVFRGVSDGRGTLNKNEKLPTGTYYYILTYEFTDTNGSNTIKKAGYLHLENN